MRTLHELWRDESGAVLSAEVVLLGTLGVIGATVGLSALSKSVNDELTELAFAIRSLDQSYGYEGMKGCRAWTAGFLLCAAAGRGVTRRAVRLRRRTDRPCRGGNRRRGGQAATEAEEAEAPAGSRKEAASQEASRAAPPAAQAARVPGRTGRRHIESAQSHGRQSQAETGPGL